MNYLKFLIKKHLSFSLDVIHWIDIEEEEPNVYSSEDFSDDVRFTKSEILFDPRFDKKFQTSML